MTARPGADIGPGADPATPAADDAGSARPGADRAKFGAAPVVGAAPISGVDPLAGVIAAMDRLRSPGGCPWDAEQSHRSLVPYAVEEAYELAEAVETDDRAALRSELGDLLLQVLFHARIAEEHPHDPFDLNDVAQVLLDKLVRRHPHVFGETDGVSSPADVERAWHEIKKQERADSGEQAEDVLAGIPVALPALARAQKVARRLRREGARDAELLRAASGPGRTDAAERDPSHLRETTDLGETSSADAAASGRADGSQELGRDLMALVLRAENQGIDAESALRNHLRFVSGAGPA